MVQGSGFVNNNLFIRSGLFRFKKEFSVHSIVTRGLTLESMLTLLTMIKKVVQIFETRDLRVRLI